MKTLYTILFSVILLALWWIMWTLYANQIVSSPYPLNETELYVPKYEGKG